MRVGYLGPHGTFSHAALLASSRRALIADPVPFGSEAEAIVSVQEGRIDAALVPVENAIEGGVNATIDTLIHEAPDVAVCAEELLPVSHALMARPGTTLDSVGEVLSHPQPLGQCRRTLARLLPGRPLRTVSSTAEAVRIVAESDAPLAAVGHEAAAEQYGVEVIARELEDFPGNATRFWWLARAADRDRIAGNEDPVRKCSIVFGGDGDDRPGWLLEALGVFASRDLNLTRIESRPSRAHLGHYVFLVDVLGAAGDEQVADALAELAQRCQSVRVLGSYPAGA